MANIHTLSSHIQFKTLFDAVLANSTQNGTGVDCLGFRRAALLINGWTGSATTLNWKLQESDTLGGSYTDVPNTTLGSAVVASTADAGTQIYEIDLAKRKRFLRIQAIGTGTAGNLSALLALFNPWNAAVTQDVTPLVAG